MILTATAVMSSFGASLAAPRLDGRKDRLDHRARRLIARSLDDSISRAAVNSCPVAFIASNTPSRAEHEQIAGVQREGHLVVRRSLERSERHAGSSICAQPSAEQRIGYGSPELASVTFRRFKSKTA